MGKPRLASGHTPGLRSTGTTGRLASTASTCGVCSSINSPAVTARSVASDTSACAHNFWLKLEPSCHVQAPHFRDGYSTMRGSFDQLLSWTAYLRSLHAHYIPTNANGWVFYYLHYCACSKCSLGLKSLGAHHLANGHPILTEPEGVYCMGHIIRDGYRDSVLASVYV